MNTIKNRLSWLTVSCYWLSVSCPSRRSHWMLKGRSLSTQLQQPSIDSIDFGVYDTTCPKTYVCETLAENAILSDCLLCTCALVARILLPVSDLTMLFDPAWSKNYMFSTWMGSCQLGKPDLSCSEQCSRKTIGSFFLNCGWKHYFKGTLRPVCTVHAQKQHEYYFRFQIWPHLHGTKPMYMWNLG